MENKEKTEKKPYKRSLIDSYRLLGAFKLEQVDPDSFYALIAADAIKILSNHIDLKGKFVLDVGGGAGYFSAAFKAAGAKSVVLEYDRSELTWRGKPLYQSVLADGFFMPFKDSSFDLAFSSNVLEHVNDPKSFIDEMLRVVKKNGYLFACYTNWLSPWGGHETSPWHYFGGEWARKRYEKKYEKNVKNKFNETLFPIGVGPIINWLRGKEALEIILLEPRYHPHYLSPLIKLPIIREVLTWNLAMLLKKK